MSTPNGGEEGARTAAIRRKEGKVNEMKYRKVRAAKEELAKVPIHEVAKIAAALVQNPGSVALKDSPPKKDSDDGKTTRGKATTQKPLDEEGPLVVATAKAFELLEIAYYGKSGLRKEDSYEAGLAEFVEGKKSGEEFLEVVASLPGWEPEYDEQGQPLPVPFDEGLKMLIPLPGYSEKRAKDDRMVRFRTWLSHFYSEHEPDEETRLVLVGNMIAEMKQNCIPPRLFSKALLLYPGWWEAHEHEQKSAAGKKGAEIKQAKQPASEPKPARKKKT
jgi:hypothetical protein